MTAPTSGASETMPETVNINGVPHHVIDERDGQIQVRRPNGLKHSWAIRLPDSPLYGENRARVVPPLIGAGIQDSGVRS